MAYTHLLTKARFFFTFLTLILLSATQGFNSFARGEPMPVNVGRKWVTAPMEITVSAELLQQWKELYAKIREEEKTVQNLFRDATNAQFKAGTQLRSVEFKKDQVDPVQLAALQALFDQSVTDLKKAKLQQKEIKKLVEKARKINAQPGSITEKKVATMRTAYNDYLARYNPGLPPVASNIVSAPPPVPPAVKSKPETQTKPTTQPKPKVKENKPNPVALGGEPTLYDPDMVHKRPGQAKSFEYLSHPFHCIFEIDTFNRATGMAMRALKPGVLFTHTDPDLKPFFRGKDLITCLGRVSKAGSYVQLTIEFQIASSHSQSNFGSLEAGSQLRFKLMNDEYISLFNLKTNMGHIDPYTGYTIFSGQYALGKQEINKLSSLELDKMRVLWSTGFEDYDVYHVDFLINQLNCLMSK